MAREVRPDAQVSVARDRICGARDGHLRKTPALLLHDALVSPALPTNDRVRFDGVYLAAGGELVGGDWYEAHHIANRLLCICIGDVAGHGLGPSLVMSRLRQLTRISSFDCANPRNLLRRLDAMLCAEDFHGIVTMFLGYLELDTGTLTYANAGHPPPVVRHLDGTATMFATGDPPLGLERSTYRADCTVELDPGSLLVMYTDGLTEARRDVLDGERRLCEAVASDAVGHAVNAADALRHAVIPSGSPDDVAILTARMA